MLTKVGRVHEERARVYAQFIGTEKTRETVTQTKNFFKQGCPDMTTAVHAHAEAFVRDPREKSRHR